MINLKQVILFVVVFYALYYLLTNIEYFMSKDPVLNGLKNQLSAIHPKFAEIEIYEGNRSYTVNKNKIFICLKDIYGRYYNRNMLVYVICHEYAHLLCEEIGHTNDFFRIFDEILAKATDLGLYNPSIPPLLDYCEHK